MADQGALDLHRREPVAGDVQDVVDAAHDPVVPLFVGAGPVAGEIAAGDLAPVLGPVALVVTVDRPEHRRPGLLDNQEATLAVSDWGAVLGHDLGDDAR